MKYRKWILTAILTSCIFLSACGKTEEVEKDPENIQVAMEETVAQTKKSNIPDIDTITREQMRDMSVDQVKDFVAEYLPNYKKVYGISEDHEMTDNDWLTIRDFMEYQLFGKLTEDESLYQKEQLDKEKLRVASVVSENEASYLLFDKETLMAMEPQEFLTWFQEAASYYGFELSDEDIASFNTTEKINDLRNTFIENMESEENAGETATETNP